MKKRLFAGFAALCMAASLASAAFAETATPETARAETPQAIQYDASEDAAGFAVSAAADPGVLPDGAQLAVSLLDDSAEGTPDPLPDYGERAAALDLTFYKEDAAVEPSGTVKVNIQLPQALAADLQAVESPTVVHRVQQDDGTTTPEVVAEADAFSADRTQVSFETDSFSVYEIYGVVPEAEQEADKNEQIDTYDFGAKPYSGRAAIYFMNDPSIDPAYKGNTYWAPESDTSTLIGMVDTTRYASSQWEDERYILCDGKNLITQWPDGVTTGNTWTVTRETTISEWDAGAPFNYILSNIFNDAYKKVLAKELGIDVSELKEDDVEAITLTAYKVTSSDSNKSDQQHHIDCTVSIKCKKFYTAKFLVKEPGQSTYNQIDSKNYRMDQNVEKTTKTPQIGSMKVGGDGITYVLTGWYPENAVGKAHGDEIIADNEWQATSTSGNIGYHPNKAELADGTVNFYAEYVPAYSQVTVTKSVTGALGNKEKDFEFTLAVTNNGTTVTGIKAKKNGGSEETIPADGKFTLKDGENIVFTNVPVGATVTVTEADYGEGKGGYTTYYKVDNAEKTQGSIASVTATTNGNTIAFTNNKDVDPDTGITLHSMPYLMVLAGVLVGGMAWMRRRKRS